jgi:hypothetical protein
MDRGEFKLLTRLKKNYQNFSHFLQFFPGVLFKFLKRSKTFYLHIFKTVSQKNKILFHIFFFKLRQSEHQNPDPEQVYLQKMLHPDPDPYTTNTERTRNPNRNVSLKGRTGKSFTGPGSAKTQQPDPDSHLIFRSL